MIIDNYIEQEIGGKNYIFKFPIERIIKAERECTVRNLILTISSLPMSLEDTYNLFKHALKGGQTITDKAIEEAYYQGIKELTLPGLQNLLIAAIEVSGTIVSKKE